MTPETHRRALLLGLLGTTALGATRAIAQDPTPEAAPEPEAEPAAEPSAEPAPEAAPEEAVAPDAPFLVGDIALGAEDAPVTVYEYASLTCPHCASFHVHTFPAIKEKYIDTGKVRFVFREVFFDKFGLWATMAARCGTEDAYHAMIDQFLGKQQVWTRADDIAAAIRNVARMNGVSKERIDVCFSDPDFARQLVEDYKANATADAVDSTPTFIINGERASGAMTVEQFSEILDSHL